MNAFLGLSRFSRSLLFNQRPCVARLATAVRCGSMAVLVLVPGYGEEITVRLDELAPWVRHVIDNSSTGADGVKFGDLNGDGLPDITTGWEEGGAVRMYLNPGPTKAKAPWPQATVGTVASPEDAVIVDLDGDGRMEVVSATEGKNRTVYVHWADTADPLGPWKTEAIPCTRKLQSWMFVLPMDVDGKDGLDLVVGSKEQGAAVGWLQSPPNPRDLSAWTYHEFRPATWVMALQSADLNGDGFPDILFSDRRGPGGGIGWLENPGRTHPAASKWKEHHIADADDEHQALFIDYADVDGDGTPEIVAACRPSRIGIFKRTGAESWSTTWLNLTGDIGGTKAVKVADLNQDGRADLVVSFENAKGPLTGIVWLEQKASGWAMHALGGPAGIKYDLVPTIDLDGDGDLDVVTTEERDQLGVIWYENPTVHGTAPVSPLKPTPR